MKMMTDYGLRSRLCGWEGVLSEFPGMSLMELSLDGEIVAANNSFCQLLGRSRRQLLGHSPLDFTHPEDQAVTIDALADLWACPAEGTTTEKRLLRGDGRVVWVRVTAVWLPERGRVLGHVVDISDVVSAKAAARAAEQRLLTLIEHSADSIADPAFPTRRLSTGHGMTPEERRQKASATLIDAAMAAAAISEQARQERLDAVLASVSERSARTPEQTARLRQQLQHLDGR